MIEPFSYSRTTESTASIDGISIRRRGSTEGTIAARLLTSGL